MKLFDILKTVSSVRVESKNSPVTFRGHLLILTFKKENLVFLNQEIETEADNSFSAEDEDGYFWQISLKDPA